MGLKKQNRDLHVHHAFWFWYISFPSLQLRRQVPNFTFCGGRARTQDNNFLFLFLNLHTVLSNSTPEKINAFNKFNEIE